MAEFLEAYWDENTPNRQPKGSDPVVHTTPDFGGRKGELVRWLIFLNTSVRYDEEQEEYCFPDGKTHLEPFNSAVLTSVLFGGRIMRFGPLKAGCGVGHGHHFTLVDGRFLADYWLILGHGIEPQPCGVFDLENPADLALAESFYGSRSGWVEV